MMLQLHISLLRRWCRGCHVRFIWCQSLNIQRWCFGTMYYCMWVLDNHCHVFFLGYSQCFALQSWSKVPNLCGDRHMWPERVVIYGAPLHARRAWNVADKCHHQVQRMMDPSYLGCIYCIWSGIPNTMWKHVIWTPLHCYTSNHPVYFVIWGFCTIQRRASSCLWRRNPTGSVRATGLRFFLMWLAGAHWIMCFPPRHLALSCLVEATQNCIDFLFRQFLCTLFFDVFSWHEHGWTCACVKNWRITDDDGLVIVPVIGLFIWGYLKATCLYVLKDRYINRVW